MISSMLSLPAIVLHNGWEFCVRNFDVWKNGSDVSPVAYLWHFQCNISIETTLDTWGKWVKVSGYVHVFTCEYMIVHDSLFDIVKASQLQQKCNISFFISVSQFCRTSDSKYPTCMCWLLDVVGLLSNLSS